MTASRVGSGRPLVDADSHVIEPPGFLDGYLESRWAGAGPRLADDDGDDILVLGDRRFFSYGMMHGLASARPGLPDAGGRPRWRWRDALLPGAWDVAARLADMDADGVGAAAVYPTVAMGFFGLADPDLARALARAYTRWISDWAAAGQGRLAPVGLLVPTTPGQAVADVQECLDLAVAAVCVPSSWGGRSYADAVWDPVFALLSEAGVPVASHAFAGAGDGRASRSDTLVEALVDRTAAVERTVVELIFGGVFDRHRGLRFVSVENEAAWAAGLVERADVSWRRGRRSGPGLAGCDRLPSEVFSEHVFCTFIHDQAAIDARRVIGAANLMWSTDYPHNSSTFPHSVASLEAQLRPEMTAAERDAIGGGNATALYRLRVPSAAAGAGRPAG